MVAQKIFPSSHMIIMEQASNYGEIETTNDNYPKPFFIHDEGHTDKHQKLDNNTEEIEERQSNLFKSIRGFLIFGKLIGVLPFSGIFGKSWKDITYRKKSLTAVVSFAITGLLVFNASVGIIQTISAPKRNALQIAESIRSTLYFVWSTTIYLYFLWHGDKFLKIFKVWNSIHVKYYYIDTTLWRDTSFITGLILLSAILENGVLHLEYFRELRKINGGKFPNDNKTSLETYYVRAHPHLSQVLGYNPVMAVLAFVQHKLILYAWNYMDIVIAVFARAMYFRFKSLYEYSVANLLGPEEFRLNNSKQGICNDRNAWIQVVTDHLNLTRLLEVMEDFFSPVVFITYAINMFYICLQLFDGLTSDELTKHSLVHSIYAPWSFIHLVMRAFVVSICCARVNVYAHKIHLVLQDCPVEHYTTEVSRLEKRVIGGPEIGFTGLGCFTVTKPFILSMLSVVFTFEIVLLQCAPTTTNTAALPPPTR